MTPYFSMCLDALRFVMALLVAVDHLENLGGAFNPTTARFLPPGVAHLCVMVFFVLSGYVIAYTTDKNKRTASSYAIARVSRIYSVLFPALILTGLLEALGLWLFPAVYHSWVNATSPWRLVATFFNAQQLWFWSFVPLSNGPPWSIAYECFYYFLFGIFCFSKNLYINLTVLFLCALIAPKIIILLPVWLVGVACYHAHRRLRMRRLTAVLSIFLFCILLVYSVAYIKYRPAWHHQTATTKYYLDCSTPYLSDFLNSIYVGLIFLLLPFALPDSNPLPSISRMAKAMGGFSFSFYATHVPVIIFLGALFPPRVCTLAAGMPYLISAIIFAYIFSFFTERHRARLATFLQACMVMVKEGIANCCDSKKLRERPLAD